MEQIDLIYDHYKETFAIISEQNKLRNKRFVFTFVIAMVLLLFTFNPVEYSGLIFGYIKEQYSIDLTNQFVVIQTFLWITLLYETLRYSQAVVYIEREYKYISSLEAHITTLSQFSFNREGQNYSNDYPIISNYANLIYKYLFPIFSVAVATLKIISEFKYLNIWYFLLIDTIIYIAYIFLWVFHSYFVIKNDK